MKKWLTLIFASLLIFVLAACGDTSDDAKSSGGDKVDTKDLEEIYEKALKRQDELKSVSADMVMDLNMKLDAGDDSGEMKSTTDFKMDMVLDPVAMYMKGKMSSKGDSEEASFDSIIESYITKDAMYLYDESSKQWMKLPESYVEDALGQTTEQASAKEQLESIKSFIDDFKVEEKGDSYVLTLNAESDKFAKFMMEQMNLADSLQISNDEKELLENMKFNKVGYVLTISKDNYDLTNCDVVLNLTIEQDGQKAIIETAYDIEFSNFNGVKEIKVPQDVIDNAIEME